MSKAEAEAKRGMLLRSAMAGEAARAAHPEGKRSTTRQLEDWHRWHKAVHGREPDAPELSHFLNLDTKAANKATMALRRIVWGREDKAGATSEWRFKRGMYSPEAVEQGNAERASQRRMRLEEM